ncbi:hypothetical protein UT300003_29060 [Clostridium sardiniense]|uniref:hypothetical protein n=1 Tax=Clostridium sardiniense TaxID=29369 RepID=UPI0019573EFE|nr:hypothetical protein [Clostridium sardiniense]MBM7836354.1 hypothetical protein [Clostridium sardiniense]
MKNKSNFIKIIAIMILFCLSSQVAAFADNIPPSNNDIIAYIDGIGLTKNDINEDGEIKNTPKAMPKANISGGGGATNRLPSGKSSALIQKRLGAPRFSQQVDDYYMTVSQAKDAAYALNSSTVIKTVANTIVSNVVGSVAKHIAKPYSYITMFSALPRISAGTKINNLTKKNKKVRLRIIKNPNGTFYNVSEWDGRTLDFKLTNNNVTKEVIFNKQYR